MKKFALLAAMISLAAPAFAGDAAKGEDLFKKKCRSCHSVISPSGEEVVKGGKTGPNLFGVIGTKVGEVEGFKFSNDMVAVGESGVMWDEASVAEYVVDPSKWVASKIGDGKKSKMSFKLKEGGEDVAAFLAAHK